MSDVLQIAAVSMADGERRLQAISENAAHATTPGFRRHVVTGSPFESLLKETSGAVPAAPTDAVSLRRGALMQTGRTLDVAIESDDLFFAVTDGEHTWLTRSGAFRLSDEGALVDAHGLKVLGTQGEIHLPGTDVTVQSDARILQRGTVMGALQLFEANDPDTLHAAGGTLLSAGSGEHAAREGSARVRGGALEASNTDGTSEMLALMSVARQFESVSRVAQRYDEALGRAIEKLGGG